MSEFFKNQEGLSSIMFLAIWFIIILCVNYVYVSTKSEKIETFMAYILLFICPLIFLFKVLETPKKTKPMNTSKDLKFLNDYYQRMSKHPFIESKEHLMRRIEWLIGYYEKKTAASPKELLEALINHKGIPSKNHMEEVRLLYYWINYKTIVGF